MPKPKKPYKKYKPESMNEAIAMVLAGTSIVDAAAANSVPVSTLGDRVRNERAGKSPVRPGPKPVLPFAFERDLVSWVGGMQGCGHPPERPLILSKANRVARKIPDIVVSAPPVVLTRHWLRRLFDRHPILTDRVAQTINRSRNAVEQADLDEFFATLQRIVAEHGLTPERIFNVDETAFDSRAKSRRVVALRGSKAVWTKLLSTNYHLSLVVCGSAAGLVVPPVFIFPGEVLDEALQDCDVVPGSRVVQSAKGWMTEHIFVQWLAVLDASVDASVQRPLLLVMDGCSSHISERITMKAEELNIILLCLPANATHLVQPLDICVFAPFKRCIRQEIYNFMVEKGVYSLYGVWILFMLCILYVFFTLYIVSTLYFVYMFSV